MAGGTGGHVFPALALARRLREESIDVVWLGTRRGLEARVVPAEGIPIEWLSVGGLRGKGWRTLLAAPWRLAVALVQALRVMRRRQPAVIVGLGGFVTGPGGVAAWLTRRPLVIHEQNAIAGFTNRCLAHLAREVLEAFPDAFAASVKARTVGNPVRRDIGALRPPAGRFAGREGAARILVIGGSQGAVRLNTVVPYALARLAGKIRFDVRHQAGERWIDAGRQSYADA
ncbi:MAG TPA: UDP-N-acetylglucosamine--N-acetylmuramyl-(pentapeptide) pyrophosphoryl-undecaprenol N-acetylglucosamine transferase, partial [Steroidobacteraceae bacterium]|nr:UDP-N-acetylglucosamine--N-acetylmuramyl-(pentapeptide) pyrophosphoryl-undecaprenol N-acetylglucosamine transferase [Steroidobacteraceae bacterium]